MSNPFAEQLTFDGFLKKYGAKPVQIRAKVEDIKGLSRAQVQKQVDQAAQLLKSFKPEKEGGI